MRTINASEFKAKCLAILDEVARTGEPLDIVKRGRPVARLIPATSTRAEFPQNDLVGSVEIVGDILSPVLPATAWEVEKPQRK
ncbi:MAG TPA: type II toxin-antitoxin system Phd/YefM family antitoxin [Acidobacteriota bacterium]|jgi:prevent-host-death family protein